MKIDSIQTGQPRTMGTAGASDPLDREWRSAIWKDPVHGRVWAGVEGLSGDVQVARPDHGGAERALLLYPSAHYPAWRREWGTKDLGAGAFGENLTVSDLTEATVCLGDLFQLGEVKIEVSGPRSPCHTLVRRHRRPDLIEQVVATDRSGWYVRVLTEGWLEAGLELLLVDRPYPQWPIDRVARVKREKVQDVESARRLAECPALVADWRAKLG